MEVIRQNCIKEKQSLPGPQTFVLAESLHFKARLRGATVMWPRKQGRRAACQVAGSALARVAKAVARKEAQKILAYWRRSCHVCHVTFSIPLVEAIGALYARLAPKDVRMTRVGRGIKTEAKRDKFRALRIVERLRLACAG